MSGGARILAGRLRLDRLVASGAMGEVWCARHLGLDKDVAVKVLRNDRRTDPEVSARFIREARAASRLDHPNSVAVLDFGEDQDGQLYLAMEFISGGSLREALDEGGAFAPTEAAGLMCQVLAALAAAHDKGVLHRDIKPSNIMLLPTHDDAGRPETLVKVCDFGLAKLSHMHDSLAANEGQRRVVGTPLYMSPEQAVTEPLDERADLYSCGVVLFEMLTGRPPYEADKAVAVLMKHCAAPIPRASQLQPGLHPDLDDILIRALAKDREDRYPSARAFRTALVDFLRDRPPARRASSVDRDTSYFIAPKSGLDQPVAANGRSSMLDDLSFEPPVEAVAEVPRIAAPVVEANRTPPPSAPPPGEASGLVPPMRGPLTQPALDPATDSRFLWERYALSPFRRPPPRGFWLVDGTERRVGPLTFEELGLALRLEAMDGSIDRCRVGADPRPEQLHPAQAALEALDAALVGATSAPANTAVLPPNRGWLQPMSVTGLLARAGLGEHRGRLVLVSERPGGVAFYDVHLLGGRPVYADTNELALLTPAVLVARGVLDELVLPHLAHEVWSGGGTFEDVVRRLTGVDTSEHQAALTRRRLRRMLAVEDGTWWFDAGVKPTNRRSAPNLLQLLPRIIQDAIPEAAMERALGPWLDRPLSAAADVEAWIEHFDWNSNQRTIAAELLAAPALSQAIPSASPARGPYLAVTFLLVAAAGGPQSRSSPSWPR